MAIEPSPEQPVRFDRIEVLAIQRETRRRLAVLDWPENLIFGFALGIMSPLIWFYSATANAPNVGLIIAIIGFFAVEKLRTEIAGYISTRCGLFATQSWLKRVGLARLADRELKLDVWSILLSVVLGTVVLAGVLAVLVVMAGTSLKWHEVVRIAVAVLFVIGAAGYAWLALRTGLVEYACAGVASLSMSMIMMLWQTETVPQLFVFFAVIFTAMGVVFFHRWRRWAPVLPHASGLEKHGARDNSPIESDQGKSGSSESSRHETAQLPVLVVLNECELADLNFVLAMSRLTHADVSDQLADLVDRGYAKKKEMQLDEETRKVYCLTRPGTKYFREQWASMT